MAEKEAQVIVEPVDNLEHEYEPAGTVQGESGVVYQTTSTTLGDPIETPPSVVLP